MTVETMTPDAVKAALSDGREIALLDIREHGQYGEGHPFFSVNCPFSRLELQIPRLAPNKSARLVLFDDGDGVALRAVAALRDMGYTRVAALEGGAPAWAAAGYTLFKGVNVPSKAYGEMVEHDMGTPHVTAGELDASIRRGENLIVLDGRTPGEYSTMNIPTALSCPNAELGIRIDRFAPDPSTRIVINCAGRTRSIIGAQTLRSLGISNPVYALKNGSQGWQLAGLQLEYKTPSNPLPQPVDDTLLAARREAFVGANALPLVDLGRVEEWNREADRTLYLFDVRTTEEYREGTMPGAVHAPGGQLVQATDQWVAVRGARIVLCDNRDLRAATTCFWLRRMGHDAYILDEDARKGQAGPAPSPTVSMAGMVEVAASELSGLLGAGAVFLDASEGKQYRQSHIEGARWAVRPRLANLDLPSDKPVVVGARDIGSAILVVRDLLASGHDARLLLGELEDWRAAGLNLVSTPDLPADEEMIDFLFFVHDRHSGSMESARRYLEWETGLLDQMDNQERSVFVRGAAADLREAVR